MFFFAFPLSVSNEMITVKATFKCQIDDMLNAK